MRDILEDAMGQGADPVKTAQEAMKTPLPKRFYKTVEVVSAEGGFAVQLDGKPIKTPARGDLVLPNENTAKLIADEFEAQETEIDPALMPVTRLANTALDGVASDPQAVFEDILIFASSDLLLYRADAPAGLVERQSESWDPVLDWFRDEFGANFILAEGIVHVAQPKEALVIFSACLRSHDDPISLACLHTVTSLTGSALLAMAAGRRFMSATQIWEAAHVDENWNIQHWGEDEEASKRRGLREREFNAALSMLYSLDQNIKIIK
ncbi:MAG: ATP12 family chaperone protein [Rhizobiaceae bacterium]